MKLIIDIHEKDYQSMKNGHIPFTVLDVLMNGTPLPKGHGRLIDADALYENTEIYHSDIDGYACVRWKDINDAPTIIEADEGAFAEQESEDEVDKYFKETEER